MDSIDDLEKWFEKTELPKSLQLYQGVFIPNLSFTVKNLIDTLRANSGNACYLPYYEHLVEIKKIIINSNHGKNTISAKQKAV